MASLLYQSIEALSREKSIDPQIVVAAVEDAIALATRKYYKTQENMRAELDKESGEIRAYIYKTVVDGPEQIEDPVNQIGLDEARALAPEVETGGEIRYYKPTDVLGRIAAQMAKQVIFQKVREAERDTVFNEYNHRVNEVLNATVKRVELQDVIFDLGKTEARMPRREQSRLEQFAIGERVRVVLSRVDRASKGPQVIVSRAAPELVQNLFQSEVPEIYDGTVVIRAIAREAGERTKIAVMSRDKDVDPVGACVGMKGMRVQSIIRELRGEKIDIIEFSEEITTFAEKALQPAKVSKVSILDLADKQIEVIVDDTQLSLAIGKKGQNVRLAAKLLGWKIDIKSEEEKRQEVEQEMQAMSGGGTTAIEQVSELGEAIIQKLVAHGITTVEALADMTPEELEEVPGIGEKTLEKISVAVRHYFGQYEEGEERPAQAAEADGDSGSEGGLVIEPADSEYVSPQIITMSEVEAEGLTVVEAGKLDDLNGVADETDVAEGEPQDADLNAIEAEGLDPEIAAAMKIEAVQTDEEIDALTHGLSQDGERTISDDGTGLIHDELAAERLAEITEVGPDLAEEGVEAVVPGRDDVSERLASNRASDADGNDADGNIAGGNEAREIEDAVLEGNVEEIRDEEFQSGSDLESGDSEDREETGKVAPKPRGEQPKPGK